MGTVSPRLLRFLDLLSRYLRRLPSINPSVRFRPNYRGIVAVIDNRVIIWPRTLALFTQVYPAPCPLLPRILDARDTR